MTNTYNFFKALIKKSRLGIALIGLTFSAANSLLAQNALDFDGSDDRVLCGNDTSVNLSGTKFTLEAWIFATAWKANAYEGNIICKEENTTNNGYMLRAGNGGRLNCAFGNGTSTWVEKTTTNPVLQLNTWHHVACTYNGAKFYFFVDGSIIDSVVSTSSMTKSNGVNLTIGDHTGTYTRRFQGRIDEVRIWAITRTPAEIKAYKDVEFCEPQKGLRAYYKFNQGKANNSNSTVNKLTDFSGFGNQGTLANFALSGASSNWTYGKSLGKSTAKYDTQTLVRCDKYRSPSGKYLWSKSGTFRDTLPTYFGCDSALLIHLTLKAKSYKSINAWACKSYTSPSGLYTYTKSGTYTDYLLNAAGCDSVLTINLLIGGKTTNQSMDVCNKFVSVTGKTYTETGIYTDTLVDYRGCDSFLVTDLKVRKTTYNTIEKLFCAPFKSPSRKFIISLAGTYKDTLENAVGCDSIITIIAKSKATFRTMNVTVCDAYVAPSERYVWRTTGTYKDTVMNTQFCDSIVTINLTVIGKKYTDIQVDACKIYKSPSGKLSLNKSGIYTDTLKSSVGCDSILNITLNVIKVGKNVGVVGDVLTCTNTTATSYQWLICNQNYKPVSGETGRIFNAKTNGNYAIEVTENNCVDTSDCYWITSAGIDELTNKKSGELEIFPNPIKQNTSTIFQINLNQPLVNGSITVYSIGGAVITKIPANSLHGTIDITINKLLSAGTYLVVAEDANHKESGKLMIN